ncbi:hypothetical protein [Desulfosporosinus sp. OT]|uniref:hypothetical protein n=1 Tax=Desulfosporosinus sp. OT TaxID=913865 RepID=UPI000223A5E5|nr:hypothetical protein [Desulfosporosinus sp. OT]EGW39178.1 hypothetical protein DOT_2911 [Desulfosporosinus sp. OT]
MSERFGMLMDMEKLINIFRKKWWIFIAKVSWISLVCLFIASFIYKQEIVLQTMNSWISLILGLIAVVLSVIAMVLSFYNTERTNEISQQSLKASMELNLLIETKLERLISKTEEVGNNVSALKDNFGNTLNANYSQINRVYKGKSYSDQELDLDFENLFDDDK